MRLADPQMAADFHGRRMELTGARHTHTHTHRLVGAENLLSRSISGGWKKYLLDRHRGKIRGTQDKHIARWFPIPSKAERHSRGAQHSISQTSTPTAILTPSSLPTKSIIV